MTLEGINIQRDVNIYQGKPKFTRSTNFNSEISKEEADYYEPADSVEESCYNCVNYNNGYCSLVEGIISESASCSYFE